MKAETGRFPILRITEQGRAQIEDTVVRETPLTIFLNDQELVMLFCSPTKLKYLALGFLASEGLIKNRDEIKKVVLNEQKGMVRVETKEFTKDFPPKRFITSSGGKGTAFQDVLNVLSRQGTGFPTKISAPKVFALVKEFIQRSEVFKATGGVHSAALCDTQNLLIFSEDIGRHNAIDKIFGECLWENIPTAGRVIVTSGRVSSEILFKVAKRNIPIIISKSAPTDVAVRSAFHLGMTLIGFVRGTKMNVYAHDWRVK